MYLSADEYVKEFELLGYTHDEAIALVDYATQPVTIDTSDWDRIVEEINNIGCTSFRLTKEELKKLLKE